MNKLKNKLRAIVAIAMMLIVGFSANAYDFEVDDIYYYITSSVEPYTVEVASSSNISGDIVIPKSVSYGGVEYSVTSIGKYAFYYCDGLTSIEIPNSVTSIGAWAFNGCNGLTSIEIPNSVTSIGEWAFDGCSGLTSVVWNAIDCNDFAYNLNRPFYNCSNITSFTFGDAVQHIPAYLCYYMSKLTSIEIPNSVNSIGNSAFSHCSGLTSIEIPNSVTSIGSGAFQNCTGLTSIEIPNSVTLIGDSAFSDCSGLTSIEIPNSVTSIGDSAFSDCSGLTSVTIGNSVTSIGNDTFHNCLGLTSVTIGNSVTSMRGDSFSGCSGLTSVVWNAINCTYSSGSSPFSDSAANITSFTFGDAVQHIPAYLCYYMSKLSSIEIPNSVTSIGNGAFSGCNGLTSATIGNSVTSIGYIAFSGCSGLTSIEIPNSVTSIGDEAFLGCPGLTSVVVEEGNSVYDSRENCNAIIETETNKLIAGCKNSFIPNSVTSIGNYTFYNCSGLTSIEIPNSVTSIGYRAFESCSGLTSVVWNAIKCNDFAYNYGKSGPFYNCSNITSFTFGDAVLHIPAYLCYEMSKLTSIEIPNSVTSIGVGAFSVCSGLTNIEIPNSVTSIGNGAFKDCSKLTIITLGNSLLSIGEDAFKECNNIKKIESKATKAPTIENEDQFSSEVYQKADLFVPLGYEDNYKYAYAWSEFNNIVGKDFTIRATSIALDKTEVTLKQSESVALTETILPYETSNKTVIWSTSDESVATVDANGLVTAISVGEATITATTADGSNLSATCKVTVVPTLVISIEVTPTEVEVEERSEVQLSVVVLPEEATNKEVAWSSSNESVATVDNNGLVSIHKEGEATITATTTDGSNLSATCVIKAFSGIVEVESLTFYVKVVGDDIVVCDAELGSQVAVYGIDGLLVGAKEVVDMQTIIAAPIKGFYLVRVGETMVKVLVK